MVMLDDVGGSLVSSQPAQTHQTNPCRHSVSCNGQLHHWMTSWEAGAG